MFIRYILGSMMPYTIYLDMDFDCKDETLGQGTLIGCGNLTACQ